MIKRKITQLDIYKVYDETDQQFYYGCDQEWYASKWKKLSGCGPTAASNLVLYQTQGRFLNTTPYGTDKVLCQNLMEEVWKYVTPQLRGVSNTKMFYSGLMKYAVKVDLKVENHFQNITKDKNHRVSLTQIIDFIDEALVQDVPVAFLNLHSGDEKELDPWHWVTLVSLEYPEDKSTASIQILDAGKIMDINLALWLATTKLGGGFVYIIPKPNELR